MDKGELDEIRDYTARECLTDAEWSALLSLAYEAVAAQERIDGWKREFEKVQAKRDAYRERAKLAEAELAELVPVLEAATAYVEACETPPAARDFTGAYRSASLDEKWDALRAAVAGRTE